MPTASKSLPTKNRKPRTSEQLGKAEKVIRDLKKLAQFREQHPKTTKAILAGIVGLGLIALFNKDE